ncbi:NAD-dependent epimerase/dehydratase family protein [Kribbella sindirgiensis]|uniref:NAD-dependent epimerase/dehydratase family protein n=1 Tax=Kribbella sindirgiensis TaxID=1124744 RepID=A0A4V2M4A1_9ACTN|nr:NAD-dependent epimerase/dehydratase family protein [Kribbella sindirgiensis]TCC35132.1 NAD-dependent epimerase/dehydratase family protein [Kribbella sindirgiensis]
MSLQIVVGAGPVGSATARLLAERGDQVRVITRSGSGPDGVERVAADASNPDVLARYAEGATTIYSCAGPPYHRWSTDWPPLGAALIKAAESSGALLVTTGNLYGYGAVAGPMTEEAPLRPNSIKGHVRAKLWTDALEAHRAGRIRTAEVRGSDYLGAGAVTSFSVAVLPKVIAGKRASAPADLDAPHSWTYVGDVARTLLAVADDETAWGRAWHVPSAEPVPVRALAARAAELAGAPPARIGAMPVIALRLAGLFNPTARELVETQYQWRRPFVLDSTAATVAFGIKPTPVDDALSESIEALRT